MSALLSTHAVCVCLSLCRFSGTTHGRLGQCTVDLSLLARAFPYLDGFYHVMEPGSASNVTGQLRVQVCPDVLLLPHLQPPTLAVVSMLVCACLHADGLEVVVLEGEELCVLLFIPWACTGVTHVTTGKACDGGLFHPTGR